MGKDWGGGLGEWYPYAPDYKDNLQSPAAEQVTMQLKVLSHREKAKYFDLEARHGQAVSREKLVSECVKDVRNLTCSGKPVLTGADLWNTQGTELVMLLCFKILGDAPLSESDVKN